MSVISPLLKKILQKATDLSVENGKKLSVDYILLAMLDEVASQNADAADEAELKAIVGLLAAYPIDTETVAALREYVRTSAQDTFGDQILYRRMVMGAETKANHDGKEQIGADLYLEYLLRNPTEAMSRFVLKEQPKPAPSLPNVAKEPAPEAPPVRQTAEPPQKAPQETKQESGLERLLGVLAETKRVQQKLLETVFGQDQAISTFISGYFQAELTALTQKERVRPRATFLFAGPPGVGKTFLAEQAAGLLKLPFRRFDMSEYSDNESGVDLCGLNSAYKYSKKGILTEFVDEHPHCILLFDEVEKAHLNVIHLFLQLLDAGRLRDNYTEQEVSFKDAILIFTTNAGRKLYEEQTDSQLSCLAAKTVLGAIASDINPYTGEPFFPAAICSRFASGNVIMFNHLGANDLIKIVDREFSKQADGLKTGADISVEIDGKVPYALMFSQGGNADARMIRGKSGSFLHQELYELYRLLCSDANGFSADKIKTIKFDVALPENERVRALFSEGETPDVLIFAEKEKADKCLAAVEGVARAHCAATLEEAKEILDRQEIRLILVDVLCGAQAGRENLLNVEDATCAGREFFLYAKEYLHIPLYLLQEREGDISVEEQLSFSRNGARGIVTIASAEFGKTVYEKCVVARQQHNLFELAKANKLLGFQTSQRVSEDGTEATITLYDLKLSVAVDAEDGKSMVSKLSKPDTRFSDVIGAADAKEELAYFVEFLKNPSKYLRKGLKAPKGVLLYGPPGTGKTLLARAMAGESNVTFLTAEGNQFLKKYVGEGAEAVHTLFATARKYAPAILFVDEIDSIGHERGSGQSADISADVLTSFLTEMDGFGKDAARPVFVLAATNYNVEPGTGRSLDPALVRRFDRKIFVDLPGKEERLQYLKLKTRTEAYKLSDEQLENVAMRSTGMSLADLENILEFALRNAFKTEDALVTDALFEDAFETYASGEEKKWDAALLERTARHESGHALVCWLHGETPSYLTIVARASHGGYMQHADSEGKALYTREELLARVRTALAGRAAEIVFYGDEDGISTGASGDLETATRIVENMICVYGMDETIGLGSIDRHAIAGSQYDTLVRQRVNEILQREFEETKRLIAEHRDAIERLVKELLLKNHLKGGEIDAILRA